MSRIIISIAIIVMVFTQHINAQKLTASQVQQVVSSRHYMFEAQTVTPQSGASRQLNTEYFLKISGDTLMSSLPYFGRAYSAPVNPSDAGYDFTLTKFEYAVSVKKKNSYQVTLQTKDKANNTRFLLTIYNNGNAYLQVTSNYKQPISYRGYVHQNK